MPRTPEQYEEIREGKRNHIMQTALELFAQQGFQNTSIADIALKGKISKGLLYHYFKNKEVLLKNIITDGFEQFIELLDLNKDGILSDEEFEYFIRESFNLMKSNMPYWKLYFTLIMQSAITPIIFEDLQGVMTNYMSLVTSYFKRKGFSNPEVEARFLAALLDGLGFHFILDPEHFPFEQSINRIINIYKSNGK